MCSGFSPSFSPQPRLAFCLLCRSGNPARRGERERELEVVLPAAFLLLLLLLLSVRSRPPHQRDVESLFFSSLHSFFSFPWICLCVSLTSLLREEGGSEALEKKRAVPTLLFQRKGKKTSVVLPMVPQGVSTKKDTFFFKRRSLKIDLCIK